ncbi:MAG: glutamate-1-semialdehyde 2,1-aminomutase [Elusimicrobiales bacterium]|nr:glutamate-1-semialdehyde 2,1-aminomutase [Elusimicrobiales bacterium]
MITNFEKSDKMIARAQELIPGGGHTYSKGLDQSPKLGPKLIERGKGCYVWDVDGNKYLDWAMGLTSVNLGHAYKPVLDAVRAELLKGSNFQCPSPIESELAEYFISQVPGAEMVKFAKNGSTVTTAALKLARAYTGRKYIAYCSDHGFFSYDDWYIGKKPNNAGVPQEVADLSLTFRYNDIKSAEELFAKYPGQIAGLILEPMEFDSPQDNFLHKLRDLCKKNGTVFILDEMITGFRLGYPGAHAALGVQADLTTWGKGVANGFSCCMLAGKRDIMNLGGIDHDKERVFLISTTHGAETHSLAAAMATIKAVKENNLVERNIKMGETLRKGLEDGIKAAGLSEYITVKGHPCWLLMLFRDAEKQLSDGFKTLVMQEAVKNGLLFRGSFVFSLAHGEKELSKTIRIFQKIFKTYKKAIKAGTYKDLLVGDPVKPVFRKFN